MRFSLLCSAIVASFLLVIPHGFAKAVISEVAWAGSDLSTSDEWLELTGIDADTDVAGWTVTSVNSSNTEVALFTFPAGTVLASGQVIIVSHFGAAQSRLLNEPAFTATSVTLPNSKLFLRLRDASGQVMDTVDDGVGSPFAGNNPSSPQPKATMERIDLHGAGDDAANWTTATQAQGFDDGAAIFGTPGTVSQHVTQTEAVSSSSSSASSASSASSQPGTAALTCPSSWDPYFVIQSGATTGDEKVTLNLQLLLKTGSMTGTSCVVDFDDGVQSQSCNPPSHTYDEPGEYVIHADVSHTCGLQVQRTMSVTVRGASSSASSGATDQPSGGEDLMVDPSRSPGSAFAITAVLPNPPGKDAGKEWIEITNISSQTATLNGWSLRLPHAKKSSFTFGDISFFLHESKKFSDADLGVVLPNSSGELSLLDPQGRVITTLTWKDPRDGIIVRPASISKTGSVKAVVTHVVDGDTLDVQIHDGIAHAERIRMIGIDAPELHAGDARQMMLGKRSAEFLRSLLEATTVTLTFGTDERDVYGRLLAYLTDEAGDSIQEKILREGMASVYLRFAFAKEAEFIGYQREAQEAGSGIWGIIDAQSSASALPVAISSSSSVSASPAFVAAALPIHIPEIVKPSSSSSSSQSKKAAAPKKSAKPIVQIEPEDPPEENFSPMSGDLLALEDIIVDEWTPEVLEEPAIEANTSSFGLVVTLLLLGICLSGAAGWAIGRRKSLPSFHS
jgi:endonuclease YncB( thermonuclease family)